MTETLRIDKFLFFARFFKSRSLAAAVVAAGEVTLGGKVVDKAACGVRPGDVVEFPAGPRRRRVEIVALPQRRGPAPEAQACYREL